MVKSILVAVDDSKSANYVLDYACNLASKFSAKIKGFYVEDIKKIFNWQPVEMKKMSVSVASILPTATLTKEQKEIEKEIIEEGFKLQAQFNDVLSDNNLTGYFSITRGDVGELIVEASKTVDLVIVGNKNKQNNKKEYETGQTITLLMKNTVRPVIVVPCEPRYSFDTILAYDGSESAQRILIFLASFLSKLNAKLHVINIADKESDSECLFVEVREFIKPYGIDVTFCSTTGVFEPWNGILEYAHKMHAGLIAIGMCGRNKNNLTKLLFGSTAKIILSASKHPVLVMR